MIRRRPRPSEAGALVLTAALLAGCGGGGGKGEGEAGEGGSGKPDPPTRATAPPSPPPVPSEFAKRTIQGPLLRLYRETGRSIGVDWWVIAAVDQIDLETGEPGILPRERIPGIGYSLAAAGAPHDDRAALVARAGGAYADRVLALSRRLVEPRGDREPAGEPAGSEDSAGDYEGPDGGDAEERDEGRDGSPQSSSSD